MENKIYRPHFSTATDARVRRTRDALRASLLDLLQTSSLDQITIRELAANAGIGYTTFFRHYPTKEDLLEEIAASEIRQLVNLQLAAFEVGDSRASSLALFRYVADHHSLWSALLTGGAAATLREEFIRIAQEVAAQRPHTTRWLPADAGILLVASGTIELLSWWLSQARPLTESEMAVIYERAVLSPIFQQYPDDEPARQ